MNNYPMYSKTNPPKGLIERIPKPVRYVLYGVAAFIVFLLVALINNGVI